MGITSAFPVPEQFSEPEGGEGETGEGGKSPHKGTAGTTVDAGEGEEPRLIHPSAEQQLAVASLLIVPVQQAQQLSL